MDPGVLGRTAPGDDRGAAAAAAAAAAVYICIRTISVKWFDMFEQIATN